ncbi:MAG: NYN domain-containing protein [Nitrospiraceae bacterium]|nr:MAG: NYN domain-containing protein [Nitrospiraceae bacterium]
MACILIDGYNLIGIAHENLEKAREAVIADLRAYARLKGHSVTIVFDGWKSGGKDHSILKSRDITIVYTRLGENADMAIRNIVSSPGTSWIVVSSDREVAGYAWRKGCAAIRSEDFQIRVEDALRGTSAVNGIEERPGPEPGAARASRKGSPKKLSKKDRMMIQALRKL